MKIEIRESIDMYMNAMWMSLREKCRCSVKVADVIHHSPKSIKNRSRSLEHKVEEKPEQEQERFMKHINTIIFFHELEKGDPSCNVIEMIFFRAAGAHHNKIEQILKVNNSIEALEKFEKYREVVKRKAFEQYTIHPRSTVDGNELLQFHTTTKTCRIQKPYRICRDTACQTCRIVHSGFKKNRIQMTASNIEDEGKTGKRAVVVCRVIAGRVVNSGNDCKEEEYDSIQTRMYAKLDYLTVQNPDAILPCFVIILN